MQLLVQCVRTLSTSRLRLQGTTVCRQAYNNAGFLGWPFPIRVLPTRWRRKPAGMHMERNCVSVTRCIKRCTKVQVTYLPVAKKSRNDTRSAVSQFAAARTDTNASFVVVSDLQIAIFCRHVSRSRSNWRLGVRFCADVDTLNTIALCYSHGPVQARSAVAKS